MEQLKTGPIHGMSPGISCNGNQATTNGEVVAAVPNGKTKGRPTANGEGVQSTDEELVVHVKSVQGRRRTMEDRFLVLNNFEPNIFGVETILAVFDGHGGSDASQFCLENFQSFFMGAVASATSSNANATSNGTCNNKSHHSQGPNEKTVVTDSASLNLNPKSSGEPTTSNKESSFINGANSQQLPPSSSSHSSQQKTIEATGDCGSSSKSSNSKHTNHQTTISDDSKNVSSNDGLEGTESPSLLSTCLRNTFLAMDQAFANKFPKSSCGTTALVVAIDKDRTRLDFANVGDSAATVLRLSPESEVVLLNDIHNTENESEEARIVALGGFLFAISGTTKRVNGSLTITRAIGDLPLKNLISAEPETETYDIEPNDRFLILASDGFYDAVPYEELSSVFEQVMLQVTEEGDSPNVNLAELLCEEALRRNNGDNITVICVPLK
ncbi:uncharacterized protein LOC142341597 [Convolutriloba macropyga]|uniref:uncharacterized protein LOC142341597 n=1 Tax=Convolutriloba macropyga TaxID=536237 RepID=UPI003F51BC73